MGKERARGRPQTIERLERARSGRPVVWAGR
jgi:hypothetical protein